MRKTEMQETIEAASQCGAAERPMGKWWRAAIVLSGIIAAQAFLYGPSLVGKRILLPLDVLAQPHVYLPVGPAGAGMPLQDDTLLDLIFFMEPARRFMASELAEGRFPMWTPYQYAGAPFVWPKFSPFKLLETCTASPVILAWSQLLAALVAGSGAYLFFRRALGVGFLAATIPAWCYPLTAFFVFWLGYTTCGAVYWFPWALLTVFNAVNRGGFAAMAALSAVTCLVLVSGHIDLAGQVLLVSGIFGLWCLWAKFRSSWRQHRLRRAVFRLVAGWALGFLLAAPHILPLLEYAQTGARMANRGSGTEERPPTGPSALPQVVLPDLYGSRAYGSLPIFPARQGNLQESSAAAYAGVFVTLVFAPLAWCSRRHRSVNFFFAFLALLGLSWCLDLPGFVDFFRLPVMNMMSHNRLTFATAFAFLALASVGLEVVFRGEINPNSEVER